ncbi:unnamed protein product [Allacma fusca]|uniref:Uncharacterized protein n=1 Tax=Allacma fusca TaxID=39272 RepID=A0A8J2KQ42_9HEXA|nr:unnamed protein product [Allacma fusca]
MYLFPEHDQKPARATLFDNKNYRNKEEYNERQSWEPGCMNFRTLDQNVGYIQTHDTCISLFMERNCKGWQTKFFKDSRVLNGPWRFKFRSIGPCADALRPSQ